MGNGDVTINANGTAQMRGAHGGTWKFENNKEGERKYVFTWTPRGRIFIDRLRLSGDRKRLEGKNQQGNRGPGHAGGVTVARAGHGTVWRSFTARVIAQGLGAGGGA
jgi:hypothetical protein